MIVAATAALSFWTPFAFKEACGGSDALPNYQCEHAQNRYYCGDPLDVDSERGACQEPLYNCTNVASYVNVPCSGGGGGSSDDGTSGDGASFSSPRFNTYATLSLQADEDDEIKAFFHSAGHFDKAALVAYAVVTFLLAVVTYGAQVATPLPLPMHEAPMQRRNCPVHDRLLPIPMARRCRRGSSCRAY